MTIFGSLNMSAMMRTLTIISTLCLPSLFLAASDISGGEELDRKGGGAVAVDLIEAGAELLQGVGTHSMYPTKIIQSGASGELLGWVDLDLGCSKSNILLGQ